jgi:hypothetical protein
MYFYLNIQKLYFFVFFQYFIVFHFYHNLQETCIYLNFFGSSYFIISKLKIQALFSSETLVTLSECA